jgi:hypothetical protein
MLVEASVHLCHSGGRHMFPEAADYCREGGWSERVEELKRLRKN